MKTWDALMAMASARQQITSLFASDAGRAEEFSITANELLFDYSKTHLTNETRELLFTLLRESGFEKKREDMFSGKAINETEGRAVLHTALRKGASESVFVDGEDVMPGVHETRARMARFAYDIRDGGFKGAGGKITDVVNIGIGGSDLGPAMAVRALAPYVDGPRVHFVSNIDGADLSDTLAGLDPATTLVVVASKTFTTIETMTNAQSALSWMQDKVENPADQFVALSSATDKTGAFGIAPQRVFGFEDWVGGRYSMWGPIGLSLMIAVGPNRFNEFLAGALAMDHHFKTAEPQQNMPIMLALVGLWHHQCCGFPSRAVLPYENRLARLPAYLQQLEMESNGKSVAMDGSRLDRHSGPIVWGEPGTNGQHAFYQLIHQGTQIVPCEFMVGKDGQEPTLRHHHELLVANCLAQSEALMVGRSLETASDMMANAGFVAEEKDRQARHRVFEGDRPSTTLLYPKLDPFFLGQIIALYEHRVFVEGVILGINSFDQWGVELGKELANELTPILRAQRSDKKKDGSTKLLLEYLRK